MIRRIAADRIWVKRGTDIVVASVSLVLLAPLMAAIALAIRCTSGAPVLFRQARPGLHGEVFTMYKFRTMRPPLPGENAWTTDQFRTTRIGRILRRTSLDELPQLINVLVGEMSLVGPRPLLVEYLPKYSPRHARRHEVRPGITGLAQINGRKCLAYSQKLDLDVRYVDEWSMRLDARILLRTLTEPLHRPEDLERGFVEFDDLGLTRDLLDAPMATVAGAPPCEPLTEGIRR